MSKFSVAAGLALALTAGSAFAADLPSRKGPPAYIPPAPVFTWTGLYGGVNIGYGFGAGDPGNGARFLTADDFHGTVLGGPAWSLSNDINGVTGGGQVGYNYQFSPWLVVGIEADMQAADIYGTRSSAVLDPVPTSVGSFGHVFASQHVDWWGTVRGRVGLTLPSWPNLMVFGTGGFAYGGLNKVFGYTDLNHQHLGNFVTGRNVYDDTATGWAAGGGFEWTPMSFPSWSLKVEYLYVDLGTTNQAVVSNLAIITAGAETVIASPANHISSTRWHTVRAGLNWHFNPFAPAPVLASY